MEWHFYEKGRIWDWSHVLEAMVRRWAMQGQSVLNLHSYDDTSYNEHIREMLSITLEWYQ